jgi:hypothetical protein
MLAVRSGALMVVDAVVVDVWSTWPSVGPSSLSSLCAYRLPGSRGGVPDCRANSGKKPASIVLEVAAINGSHRLAGHQPPSGALAGQAVRADATSPPASRARLRISQARSERIRARSHRSRASGTGRSSYQAAGVFRRSDLAGLEVRDLTFAEHHLEVTARRSETDHAGNGSKKGMPYGSDPRTCAVRAVSAWLQAPCITARPVLRLQRVHTTRPGRGSAALGPEHRQRDEALGRRGP